MKIKLCPFHKPKTTDILFTAVLRKRAYVKCMECGARGPIFDVNPPHMTYDMITYKEIEGKAIKAWNARSEGDE